jgi:purine-binding chemotaxis protein CheW
MRREEIELDGKLRELVRQFDRGFAERPAVRDQGFEDLLALRVGRDAFMIRLRQIAGLFSSRKIVPLPSPLPELLGLASFRATIVPVYDLSALLGRSREIEPRWLVMATELPIALGFSELIGHRRLALSDIVPEQRGQGAGVHVRDVARADDGLYPVIDVGSLVTSIRRLGSPGGSGKGA